MPSLCPCFSGRSYRACCGPLHGGAPAADALRVMRSRFSAYTLRKFDHIISTTCPDTPAFEPDAARWRKDIANFSRETLFLGLQVVAFTEQGDRAWVTFIARLRQKGADVNVVERSTFVRRDGVWLYADGQEPEHYDASIYL